jgi:hypothetical protein
MIRDTTPILKLVVFRRRVRTLFSVLVAVWFSVCNTVAGPVFI